MDTNSAAGTGTTGTYSVSSLNADGVLFDLSFDITASGGTLNGTGDGIGVNDGSETSTDDDVNGSEALAIGNVTISNETGGSVTFDTILRVGFEGASAAADSGQFTQVNGTSPTSAISWVDLPEGGDLDGTNATDSFFDLGTAFGAPVFSFTVASTGGAWRLDALEMQFTGTAVPEPSPFAFLGLVVLVPCWSRRRTIAALIRPMLDRADVRSQGNLRPR